MMLFVWAITLSPSQFGNPLSSSKGASKVEGSWSAECHVICLVYPKAQTKLVSSVHVISGFKVEVNVPWNHGSFLSLDGITMLFTDLDIQWSARKFPMS